MTDSELMQLRIAGFTKKEIFNLRKVVRTVTFLTSNFLENPNVTILNIPEEARYFFGLRRHSKIKAMYEFDLKINDELIVEHANTSLFECEKQKGQVGNEYIELSRRLHGNDNVIIFSETEFTILEQFTYFYCVDSTVQPKEGK